MVNKSSVKKAATAAIYAVGLATCSVVWAGGITRLPVTARVAAKCAVATGVGTLTFSVFDQSGGAAATATQALVMRCSSGTVSTAALDDGGLHNVRGQMQMVHASDAAVFLPYSITYSNDAGFEGTGFGAGTASQTVIIKGIITSTQFRSAFAATDVQGYSDTVTLTVNP